MVHSLTQSEALDVKLSVEETMVEAAPDAKINDIKALLGRMMFSGKSMAKRVSLFPMSLCSLSCQCMLGGHLTHRLCSLLSHKA
jgi:hypothetical protein